MDMIISIALPWLLMAAGILYNFYYTKHIKKKELAGEEIKYVRRIPEGLFYGMVLGAGAGLFLGQMQWGLGIGVTIGVLIGTVIKRKQK